MKMRIAEEDKAAEELIPPTAPDGSGIGVHYIDAYIKPLNTTTEEGIEITCKRKGLKLILSVGDKTGEAVVQRIEHGPDVRDMLRKALESAASDAGAKLSVEDGVLFIES